jgi:hypothetical protein
MLQNGEVSAFFSHEMNGYLEKSIAICNDLVHAGLVKESDIRREHRRYIRFKKIKGQQSQNSGLKTYFN